MIGSEIKEFVEELIDDSMSDTLFLNILNSEKSIVEGQKQWQFLKKLDSSNTATAGNNSDTGIALPSDFRSDYKMFIGEDIEYYPVKFELQHLYRNSSRNYVLDIANLQYKILGNIGKADTIYFYYIKTTPELALTTAPVWPIEDHHKLLAYRVAARYMSGVDVDDIFQVLSKENRFAALEIQSAMDLWDSQLQNRGNNKRLHFSDGEGLSEDEVLARM